MHILDNDKHRQAPLCVYAIFASKYKIQMSFLFTYLLPYLLISFPFQLDIVVLLGARCVIHRLDRKSFFYRVYMV